MNIFLTGGTGYIGRHTAVVLLQLGHRVVLYDNLSNSSDAVLEKLSQITGQTIPFIEGDVRDTDSLKRKLASRQIDAVIHFAGLKAVGESVERPVDYYSNNVQGTISLLRAMQSVDIKTLLFSSSAAVYGEPKYLPLDENHSTIASNPYGRSKLHIEDMLKDVAASAPDWRIACLRYFNPLGTHESGLLGENPNGMPTNLMPNILQVATGLRPCLNIFGGDYPTEDGTGVRDYIHVMDLAEGHAAALSFLSQNPGWHAINLGTGQGYSVLELVQAFEKASGCRVPYQIEARRDGDVAACFANTNKASQCLSWHAMRSLDDMCRSTWRAAQCKR